VLPNLHLRGLSTGDFGLSLCSLLDEDAAELLATNISRLTSEWEEEYRQFQQRRFSDWDYAYAWAYGVHFYVRQLMCPRLRGDRI